MFVFVESTEHLNIAWKMAYSAGIMPAAPKPLFFPNSAGRLGTGLLLYLMYRTPFWTCSISAYYEPLYSGEEMWQYNRAHTLFFRLPSCMGGWWKRLRFSNLLSIVLLWYEGVASMHKLWPGFDIVSCTVHSSHSLCGLCNSPDRGIYVGERSTTIQPPIL